MSRTLTEQDILDLEREHFLKLCGEQKTRDRIAYMLQNPQSPRPERKLRLRLVKT